MRPVTLRKSLRFALAILGLSALAHAVHAVNPNTGLPGSACEPLVVNTQTEPLPDAGVFNTLLDGANPPHYYEYAVTDARSFDPNDPPRLFMFIHPGRWFLEGSAPVVQLRLALNLLRSRGWQTLSIGYRGCENSLDDVVRFYDIMRERLGPDAVICAQGEGSGGHLALMLGALRPELACILAEGAPTDLVAIAGQPTFVDPNFPLPVKGVTGGEFTQNLAIAAFGEERLAELSPVRHAQTYANAGTRITLLMAEQDTQVPIAQIQEFEAAVRALNPDIYLSTRLLPPANESGAIPFVGGFIARDSAIDLFTELGLLLTPLE